MKNCWICSLHQNPDNPEIPKGFFNTDLFRSSNSYFPITTAFISSMEFSLGSLLFVVNFCWEISRFCFLHHNPDRPRYPKSILRIFRMISHDIRTFISSLLQAWFLSSTSQSKASNLLCSNISKFSDFVFWILIVLKRQTVLLIDSFQFLNSPDDGPYFLHQRLNPKLQPFKGVLK